jgi:hypothetical protein
MQILSRMSRTPSYIMGGGGTHVLNFAGLTKAVKLLPDFRSENFVYHKSHVDWPGLELIKRLIVLLDKHMAE